MSYKLTKSCLEDNIGPICIHILIRVIFIVTRHFQITNYCNINTIANEKFRKCKDQLECHKWFLGFIHCLCCCIIKLIKYVHMEALHWSNIAPHNEFNFLANYSCMIKCYPWLNNRYFVPQAIIHHREHLIFVRYENSYNLLLDYIYVCTSMIWSFH